MPDITTTVKTLDFQMLDADRQDATLIKLDNPKANITREMVSAAMQPAFANGWFLTTKGSPAMYLGDVTISTSTKVKLDGQDFYITPSAITQNWGTTPTAKSHTYDIDVSGATIQGYNIIDVVNGIKATADSSETLQVNYTPLITGNNLKFQLTIIIPSASVGSKVYGQWTCKIILVIQGTQVNVPVNIYGG